MHHFAQLEYRKMTCCGEENYECAGFEPNLFSPTFCANCNKKKDRHRVIRTDQSLKLVSGFNVNADKTQSTPTYSTPAGRYTESIVVTSSSSSQLRQQQKQQAVGYKSTFYVNKSRATKPEPQINSQKNGVVTMFSTTSKSNNDQWLDALNQARTVKFNDNSSNASTIVNGGVSSSQGQSPGTSKRSSFETSNLSLIPSEAVEKIRPVSATIVNTKSLSESASLKDKVAELERKLQIANEENSKLSSKIRTMEAVNKRFYEKMKNDAESCFDIESESIIINKSKHNYSDFKWDEESFLSMYEMVISSAQKALSLCQSKLHSAIVRNRELNAQLLDVQKQITEIKEQESHSIFNSNQQIFYSSSTIQKETEEKMDKLFTIVLNCLIPPASTPNNNNNNNNNGLHHNNNSKTNFIISHPLFHILFSWFATQIKDLKRAHESILSPNNQTPLVVEDAVLFTTKQEFSTLCYREAQKLGLHVFNLQATLREIGEALVEQYRSNRGHHTITELYSSSLVYKLSILMATTDPSHQNTIKRISNNDSHNECCQQCNSNTVQALQRDMSQLIEDTRRVYHILCTHYEEELDKVKLAFNSKMSTNQKIY